MNRLQFPRFTIGGAGASQNRVQPPSGGRLGIGRGKTVGKRHRKILRDNIHGITKGDIRRLARRGGVKRISAAIYPDVRFAIRKYLETHLHAICCVVEAREHKTVMTSDVVFSLKRMGRTLVGFGEPHSSNKLGV